MHASGVIAISRAVSFLTSVPTAVACMMCRWDEVLAGEGSEDEEDAVNGVDPSQQDSGASAPAADSNEAEPPPGTLRFYLKHLADEIYPGASVTLLQHCYVRMLEKLKAKTKDNYFDKDCRILKTSAGDSEHNFYPPTLGMTREILGTREAHQCERHVCPCDQHAYPYVPLEEYWEHREDVCPDCATPRFNQVRALICLHCSMHACMHMAAVLQRWR